MSYHIVAKKITELVAFLMSAQTLSAVSLAEVNAAPGVTVWPNDHFIGLY